MRVFVNGRPVALAPGAVALDAVTAFDASLVERVRRGGAHLTDGRGVQLPVDAALSSGSIIRIVVSARRGGAEGTKGDHGDTDA